MDTLNWGLLGTARINRSLIPALQQSDRAALLAVASRDVARARAHADQWSIPRAYGSYEALLKDPDIDAVYIPLPNVLHAEWVVKAVEAGKHVLCEKPLTLAVEDVDAIRMAAAASGRLVAEAFMYRHHAQTVRVKSMLRDGAVGELRLIRGSFSFTLNRPNDIRWIADGGGCLWDVGCYPVNYARYVLDAEPNVVYGSRITGPTGIDVQFAGQLSFPNEVLVQIDASFTAPLRMQMEFVGSDGILTVPNAYKPGEQNEIILETSGRQDRISVQGRPLYLDQVDDFADSVLKGTPHPVSLIDSRGNIETLLALHRSARNGVPVQVA